MTPSLNPLRRYVPGNKLTDEITAANLNQPIEVLDQLRKDVLANRDATRLGDLNVKAVILGLVTYEGGNGEADDTTKPRYWIKPQRVSKSTYDSALLDLVTETTPGQADRFRATNLCESTVGHGLDTDDVHYVLCYCVSFDGYPPTDHWFFFKDVPPLRYGKIQSTDACNTYCIVKQCDSTGLTIFSDTLVTVLPTKGGCDAEANGFCYSDGDVIAYILSPNDSLVGYQVGAYKKHSLYYQCLDSSTNTAGIGDLQDLTFYNGDFHIKPQSNCGGTYTNGANIAWRGNIVKGYGLAAPVGATNVASTGGVKIFDFDSTNGPPASGTVNVDYVDLPFVVSGTNTTDSQPTINGVTCTDYSLPQSVTIKVRAPLSTVVTGISGATCNPDGTITITYSTARGVVF